MITTTYLGAAAVAIVLGALLLGGKMDRWSFIAIVGVTFFLASAGASSAYLTVSEIFPMETRALAIAFFYAVGTGIGGITGPLLFGNLINSGKISEVATGFFIGAVVMAIGGFAELLFGVRSEQRPLEDVAPPLSAEATADETEATRPETTGRPGRRTRQLERYRPGPGQYRWYPGMSMTAQTRPVSLDREVDRLVEEVTARGGSAGRGELERALGARYWGPGRLSEALRIALRQGRLRRVGPASYVIGEHTSGTAPPRPEPGSPPQRPISGAA